VFGKLGKNLTSLNFEVTNPLKGINGYFLSAEEINRFISNNEEVIESEMTYQCKACKVSVQIINMAPPQNGLCYGCITRLN
jgi:membrane-bound inhibitor of C-type lysozyme